MAVGAVLALGAIGPAGASADPSSSCPSQQFSQPFLAWGDANYYTLVAGQSVDNFDATGWTLVGGAKLVTTTLDDGAVGQVLDLPAGAKAISPAMCVEASLYPQARAMVADIQGTLGVQTYVSYDSAAPVYTGVIKSADGGWDPSVPVRLHSSTLRGVHTARFTLVGASNSSGKSGETRLYDWYVDPKMRY